MDYLYLGTNEEVNINPTMRAATLTTAPTGPVISDPVIPADCKREKVEPAAIPPPFAMAEEDIQAEANDFAAIPVFVKPARLMAALEAMMVAVEAVTKVEMFGIERYILFFLNIGKQEDASLKGSF
ncbi:hypothetical protein FDP41_010722 [Naegleria fowleri]|uniref:Uncharacterized protein n=1 Tax=Naegleria fowleri TaxID=5763 RepID=A0A6A5BXC7_NAEFO|nr:uncharacterized protein FDP41_010722 [Naegleria fowleri]KAF0982743.1 hypothetical protein FDP41_010722 [Naegleria fowleri]